MAKKKTKKRRTPRERVIQKARNLIAELRRLQRTYGEDAIDRAIRGDTKKGGA